MISKEFSGTTCDTLGVNMKHSTNFLTTGCSQGVNLMNPYERIFWFSNFFLSKLILLWDEPWAEIQGSKESHPVHVQLIDRNLHPDSPKWSEMVNCDDTWRNNSKNAPAKTKITDRKLFLRVCRTGFEPVRSPKCVRLPDWEIDHSEC